MYAKMKCRTKENRKGMLPSLIKYLQVFPLYTIVIILNKMLETGFKKEFEDTKGLFKTRKWKDRQHNGKKGQTTIYTILHSKLKIE